MPRSVTLFAFIAILTISGVAAAQDDIGARMSQESIGDIHTGTYSVGEEVKFSLNRYLDRYLLRFAGDPEIYVLYADHGSLGGRVLRYDSGATALQVSGWGAITLYTDAEPSGLPAERTGASSLPTVAQVSLHDMQTAADDEAKHLAYTRRVHISFSADWPALAGDPEMRAFAFDAMQNAGRGIDRFAATRAGRTALNAKVDAVQIVAGGRPLLELRGRTLDITFDPAQGFSGRASSRGIARALGLLFSVPMVN